LYLPHPQAPIALSKLLIAINSWPFLNPVLSQADKFQ
jgi:hypothetical protein